MFFRVAVLSGCKRCGRNACAGCAVRGVIATGASRRGPEPGPDWGLRQGGRFGSDRAPRGRRVMGSRANGARSSVSLTREHGRGGACPSSRLSTHFRDPAGNGGRSEPKSDDQPRPDDEARSNARVERSPPPVDSSSTGTRPDSIDRPRAAVAGVEDIDVWRLDTTPHRDTDGTFDSALDASECDRLRVMRNRDARLQFCAGRWLARHVLARRHLGAQGSLRQGARHRSRDRIRSIRREYRQGLAGRYPPSRCARARGAARTRRYQSPPGDLRAAPPRSMSGGLR